MSTSNIDKIISKEATKKQRENLQKALKEEKSQGAALRTLKRLNKKYDYFNLSKLQAFILDNHDECFKAVQSVYTPTMQQKVKQIERKKAEKTPLTKVKYLIFYENNGVEFKARGSWKTEKDAKEAEKGLTVSNTRIEKKETEIPTSFTPNEMLLRLQFIEKKFYKEFKTPKAITLPMILRAIGEDVTKKDKKTVETAKVELNKAS